MATIYIEKENLSVDLLRLRKEQEKMTGRKAWRFIRAEKSEADEHYLNKKAFCNSTVSEVCFSPPVKQLMLLLVGCRPNIDSGGNAVIAYMGEERKHKR